MHIEAFEQYAALERTHWWFRARRRVYFSLLHRHFGHARPRSALEIGSGVGGFLKGLSNFAEHVQFLDVDARLVAHCSQRGFAGGAVGDVVALPYADRSFDLVCAFDVLQHIRSEDRALAEIRRVLRPGGLMILTVPAYSWLFADVHRTSGRKRRYTRSGLKHVLVDGGFKVERNTHTNIILFPFMACAAMAFRALELTGLVSIHPGLRKLSTWIPRWLDRMLYRVFAAELTFSSRFDLPFGHSIAAIARAPMGRRAFKLKRMRRVQRVPRPIARPARRRAA